MKRKLLSCVLMLALLGGIVGGCGKSSYKETQLNETQLEEAKETQQSENETEAQEQPTEQETETQITAENKGEESMELHVEGRKLCDANGKQIQLRGVSTHGIAWFPDYVNEAAVADLKSWGANVFRIAMYTAEYDGYCTGGDQSRLKSLVDAGVEAATKNEMYVIIDWHVLNDNDPNTYKDQAIAFFDEMSAKYASYDNVIYEICNEPCNGTSWSSIKSYAETVIPVIRKNAPESVIIVGTPNWSQFVNEAAADPITKYDNIMYALHFYAATHKDDLRNTMIAATKAGLPIFVSEYGICDASGNGAIDVDSANQWLSTLDEYGISYVCWNLSNKDESSAILKSSCNKTSGFTKDDLSEEGVWLYNMLQSKK